MKRKRLESTEFAHMIQMWILLVAICGVAFPGVTALAAAFEDQHFSNEAYGVLALCGGVFGTIVAGVLGNKIPRY